MGGFGSTRWNGFTKRALVEDCLQLDLVELRRQGLLKEPRAARKVEWRNPRTKEVLASALLVVETRPNGARGLAVGYRVTGPAGSQWVNDPFLLVPRECPFGGRRWLIECPGLEHECGRRVVKLYLPPRAAYYRCRICYGLTYLSVQAHDKRVDALKRDPEAMLAASERATTLSQMDLVMKTFPRWLQPLPDYPYPARSDARLEVMGLPT